jgi:hypothetical protein
MNPSLNAEVNTLYPDPIYARNFSQPYPQYSVIVQHQFLFLSTRPVLAAAAGAAFAAGAFLVAVPVTPFRIVPITVLFAALAGGGAALAVVTVVVRFLTTVPVLPSLDSLMALTLRVVLDVAPALGGAGAAAVAAPLLVLVAAAALVVPLEELAVEDIVVFRAVAAARVERAFSTMLLNMPLLTVAGLVGETGRAMSDLPGEATTAARSRGCGRMRLLDDVGDRTWEGLGGGLAAGPARAFFLGFSICVTSFSLSPPERTSLVEWLANAGSRLKSLWH